MRETFLCAYTKQGTAGINIMLRSAIVFGTTNSDGHGATNAGTDGANLFTSKGFGPRIAGCKIGCKYCATLPLAEQHAIRAAAGKGHNYGAPKVYTGREKHHAPTGCPNWDAAEKLRKEREALPVPPRKKGGRPPGQGNHMYVLPSLSAATRFTVCSGFFANTFSLGATGGKRMIASLLESDRAAPLAPGLPRADTRGVERRAQHKDLTAENFRIVKDHLKRIPRTASHFRVSSSMRARYLLDADLNLVKLWMGTLETMCVSERTTEERRLDAQVFIEQAKRLRWWGTLDSKNRTCPPLLADEELKKCPFGSDAFCRCVDQLDVRFGKEKTDTCATCTKFQQEFDCCRVVLEAREILNKWNDHKITADVSYDVVKQDEKHCRASWDKLDHVPEPHKMQEHAVKMEIPDFDRNRLGSFPRAHVL